VIREFAARVLNPHLLNPLNANLLNLVNLVNPLNL
jgi:hypothetical protein